MRQTDPQSTFAEAQAAMMRADWAAFFACLAQPDLLMIAGNSVNQLLTHGQHGWMVLLALCDTYAIPVEKLETVHACGTQVTASAHTITPHTSLDTTQATATDSIAQFALRHKQLVDAYSAALKSMLTSASDLPRLTAALEQQMRLIVGGGSVSSKLFVDESLDDIVIEGNRAWATRKVGANWEEDIGFIRKRSQWYIRLMAKKPKRLRSRAT